MSILICLTNVLVSCLLVCGSWFVWNSFIHGSFTKWCSKHMAASFFINKNAKNGNCKKGIALCSTSLFSIMILSIQYLWLELETLPRSWAATVYLHLPPPGPGGRGRPRNLARTRIDRRSPRPDHSILWSHNFSPSLFSLFCLAPWSPGCRCWCSARAPAPRWRWSPAPSASGRSLVAEAPERTRGLLRDKGSGTWGPGWPRPQHWQRWCRNIPSSSSKFWDQ